MTKQNLKRNKMLPSLLMRKTWFDVGMLLSLISFCPLVLEITEISPLGIKSLFFKGLLLGRSTHSNWVSRSQRHDECGPGQTGPACNVIPGIVERQQSHHCLSAAENTGLLILCRLHLAPPPDPLLCAHATFSPICCNWKKTKTMICLSETARRWLYRPTRQQKAQNIAPS